MRYRLIRRALRVAAILSLALFQINLLWVAALHHHEQLTAPRHAPAAVEGSDSPQGPVVDNGVLCTACQIVRHAAARPATGAVAPESRGSISLVNVSSLNVSHSYRPSARYGRAPPRA